VAHLRAPEGCPWDREQTHESLRRHLLEESYEVLQAIEARDMGSLKEELGDLLLQIVLHAQIASENSAFTVNDVTKGILDKIIRRHPHVFSDLRLEDVNGVLANWERLKEHERESKEVRAGLLEGVPLALPALSQAQEYQDRVARVGFDWHELDGVLEKIGEEVEEVQRASSAAEMMDELGDLLFAIVNFSRWKGLDAEAALRGANQKFRRRFAQVEDGASRQKRKLTELSLDEMDVLWRKAKSQEA
jgi:tetrapyrrole methylase family protein/MazG family protein